MKDLNQRPELRNPESGTLYVVSTPIGNLEDVTLRALKILKDVDMIAAENTRQTRGFCSHYNIKTRLISYHQHNQRSRGPELIERLKKGSDIALVTSAGTPSISDPGSLLVNMALGNGIRVSPIPGPSAAIAALSVSGLHVDRFLFLGFLSNKTGKRKKELRDLAHEQRCMVFYEAPHRIKAMLKDINEVLGDRYVVILRELTKIYEEIKRGTVSLILKELDDHILKGEFTVVLAGAEKKEDEDFVDNKVRDTIKRLLLERKMGVKEVATRLSKEFGLNYRTVYKEGLIIKKAMES
jgi:16S rRNA (cytidine1402-2'-O)-methyltransferase